MKSLEEKIAYYEKGKNSKGLWAWNNLMNLLGIVTFTLSIATVIIESFIPLETYFKSQFVHLIIGWLGVRHSFFVIMAIVLYLILCTFFALINIQWKFLRTFGKRNTDFRSFIFYIENASIITPALCFNFLTIFELDNAEFYEIMGNYNIVPIFGNYIPKMFPLLLIVVCFFFILRNLFSLLKMNRKTSLASLQNLQKSLVVSLN